MLFSAASVALLVSLSGVYASPVPAPPGITSAPKVARQASGGGAGGVIALPGIGKVFSVTGGVSQGYTVVAGKTLPVFQAGGVFAPYNVTGPGFSANNVFGGTLGLTYKTVNGQVLPDLTYYAFQDQTEHITIPGVLTFSDGSGPGSVDVPQVIFSGDLYSGFSGAFGNGAISFDLLGQTVILTDTNGFAGNPTSGAQAGFSGGVIVNGNTIGGSAGGALNTQGAAGTAVGGLGPLATGNAAGSALIGGTPGFTAGGTILSALGVQATGGVNGGCLQLSVAGAGAFGNCATSTKAAAAAATSH